MSKKHSYVLGLNCYDHDVSACLLRDGEIACAIAKERITRKKNAMGFYQEVVDYCLDAEDIELDDIELVVRSCYVLPVEDIEQRLLYQDEPRFLNAEERMQAAEHPYFLSKSSKMVTVSHHLAHAYSAFAVCPFEDGVVMVVDGVGSYRTDVSEPYPSGGMASPLARESESYYRFEGSNIAALKKVWMEPARGFLSQEFFDMSGLGAIYSRAATYVFGHWNLCGELMGLAPYGRPERFRPMLELKDGELAAHDWSDDFKHPWLATNGQRWESSPSMRHWEDLAWRVQNDTENVLLARAKWLHETTRAGNLCIAGGVALNCVANGRIVREAGFENVWIQPAAGDDGIAIGCAYYGYLAIQKNKRGFVMQDAYLGASYRDEDLHEVLSGRVLRLFANASVSRNICAETATLLAEGKVVGWFQGRSEFGPRALGNRSILADPRGAAMKDHLNDRVKHRQPFRPFAPIVLAERANDIFEGDEESPFMLLAKRVRPQWKDRIPAVVHIDGTARVQTVTRAQNEVLYDLLKSFEALTGVPVLLNTSFNVKGEPIVESPRDAVRCFLTTGIDYLVLHNTLMAKSACYKSISWLSGRMERLTQRKVRRP